MNLSATQMLSQCREGGKPLRPCGARQEVPTSTSAVMPGTLPAEWRCALRVSPPNITALLLRESVASVSGQCGVPQWPGSTRPRLADASPPAASLRGLGRVTSSSAVMYRRHSLHFCGRRACPLDFCWKVMALADCPVTPATQTHRAARSDTLASRSLLSAAHHRFRFASRVVQSVRTARLRYAQVLGEVHRQCSASVSQLTNCTTLRRATASAHGHQRGHARNAALYLSCAAR